MDPYLEQHWRDVHTALIAYTRDALNGVLPNDLIARSEEQVSIEPETGLARSVAPDLRVFEDSRATATIAPPARSGRAIAEPVILYSHVEPITERYVTVVNAETEKLITVIEFLSPTNNRPGDDMRLYQSKRQGLLYAKVNVVEIDLVREGDWERLLLPTLAHPECQSDYRITIHRGDQPGRAEFFPISLRQRLPEITIPLRPTDPQVTLDLQPLIDQAYKNGRYDRTDYSKSCDPPLDADDAAWMQTLVT
jgi:hypothetical protein